MEALLYEENDKQQINELTEEQRLLKRNEMIQGYQEMAEINLHIANEGSHAESDAMKITESFLK